MVVKAYANGNKNPYAHMRTVEVDLENASAASDRNPRFLKNEELHDHLKVTDCSQVSDGAAAIILAGGLSAAYAARFAILAFGSGDDRDNTGNVGELAALIGLSGAVLAGVAAYSCLMKAMRTGDVSAVTPFRYTRLLFGIALGIVVFGEQVNASMMLGAALIVLSGLFILWRGKQATPPGARQH